MKTDKNLYKVSLNWANETYDFHTWASSEKGALLCAVARLSQRLGLTRETLMPVFLYPKRDNSRIERVKKGG